MKKIFLYLGVLLFCVIGIVLVNIFWQDQNPKDIKVLEDKKSIEDSQLESSIKKKKEKSLTGMTEISEKEILNDRHKSDETEDSSTAEIDHDRQYKRMLGIERRKNMMAERKHYQIARREWRKSLNEARKEAKSSGNYTEYETLKREEPAKNQIID